MRQIEVVKLMPTETPEIKRPWGGYTILNKTKTHWTKKLFVHKGARISLQSHQYRNEIWFVLSGEITVQLGNKKFDAKKGDLIFVPKTKKHRIIGKTKACVFEVAYGKVLERDIVRYEDDYGRA